MKKLSMLFAMAAAIIVAGSLTIAQGQAEKSKKADKSKSKEVVYVSSDNATYTEKRPGVSMAVLWGNPDKGAHGTFTKFAPGCYN